MPDLLSGLMGLLQQREVELEIARAALEPFASFADLSVDEVAEAGLARWRDVPGEQMQRIVVWFGPSDFHRARVALNPRGGR